MSKVRPSELIRALLKSGVPLREAARIAKTSHGSCSLERKLMRQEKEASAQALAEADARKAKELLESEIALKEGKLPMSQLYILADIFVIKRRDKEECLSFGDRCR